MSEAPTLPPQEVVHDDVRRALAEDIGSGDLTAQLLPGEAIASAHIVAKEAGVLAGTAWFDACFHALDTECELAWSRIDAQRFEPGDVLCRIRGRARALVSAERSALNFLQTLSGTATAAAAYVSAIRGTRAVILDTRKTLPGLRLAQKYAVQCGGASNHRIGLYDAILIKENHIAAAGSIARAVARARELAAGVLVVVEVESLDELREALASGVDRVMLDDFAPADLRQAVAIAGGRCALEVSGGVSLATVRAIAETGVDYISVGALTKHVHAIDLSMRIVG